nr:hypothetical protein [uncultured Halomonas sp.]
MRQTTWVAEAQINEHGRANQRQQRRGQRRQAHGLASRASDTRRATVIMAIFSRRCHR